MSIGLLGRIAALLTSTAIAIAAHAEGVKPEEAQKRLTEGNQRFATGGATNPRCDEARRSETAENGQHPFATILTCSDSRVAADRIFDQGVGDLFTVRVAGNVADTDEIATIEYGVGHLHTPLLVVMGHTACGAVNAVVSGAELEGSLPQLVDNIEPAVRQARKANPAAKSDLLVTRAIEANVFQSIADLLERSPEIREQAKEGNIKVIGAVYDLSTGTVRWLGQHPEQSSLVFNNRPAGSPKPGAAHAGNAPTKAGGHDAPKAHASKATAAGPSGKSDAHGSNSDAQSPTDAGHGTRVAGATAEKGKDGHGGSGTVHGDYALPSSEQVLEMLRDGNQRFATGAEQHPHTDKQRLESTAKGQHPIATVLTCADSRVPSERIFDQGIGDVFVVRFAGNVADVDQIASIEYATGHLGTPLLVVLGHTSCGAVGAVASNAELHGSLPKLVDNIQPAVARTRNANPGLTGNPLVAAAIRANVFQSMNDLLANSSSVRKLVEAGKLRIVGGVYDIVSGKIDWLSDPLCVGGEAAKPVGDSTKPADSPKTSGEHLKEAAGENKETPAGTAAPSDHGGH